MIAKDPRVLSSSLENRLKPRLAEQAQEVGILIDTGSTMQGIAKMTAFRWSNSMIFQTNKQLKDQLRGR
jgi:hypothetical protein